MTIKQTKLPRPTDPVILLCCAIATQEGWFVAGSTPQDLNNPGDLRFAGQMNASAPGWNNQGAAPIATFSSTETGIVGLFRQIWLQIAEGQTPAEIIAQWAPPNENDTSAYLDNVIEWTGLDPETPMLDQIAPLVALNL